MSRVIGPGSVPNFWLISQLFWALSLYQGEAEDEGWALGGVMQLLYIPTPTVGPSGRESYYLFFPCTEHQEGLAEQGWATRTSPTVACCVYSIFIAHSGDPELRSVLPFFPQTLFEHHAEGSGAGLEATEHGCTPPCDTAVGLG